MKDSTPIESPFIRTLSLRGLNAYAGCENPGAVSSLDACDNAAAGAAVVDGAVGECEQRVVATETDIAARVDLRAALANQYGARGYRLTGEDLDAATLTVAVAAVS